MKRAASLLTLLTCSGLANALSGQVTDTTGRAIGGATVSVVGSREVGRSNPEGRFNLDTGTSEAVELHITAPGYSHKALRLEPGQREALSIVLAASAIENIDVIGTPLHTSTMESAQPVTVVAGEDLRRKQAPTLGETLKNEVGVHSSYFGPVASSPIIRGLNGPRVLITQNGLDASDASRVGPDHFVATEATTARQIEILRGPATLLYGSGAIGGVVNIVDDRVPSSSESRGAFLLERDTVNDGDQAALEYNGGSDRLALHIDGFWRDGDDYEIPGAAEAEAAHGDDHDHEDEEHGTSEDGVLSDSAAEGKGLNLGASWLLDNGYVGLSYGRLEQEYGIPGHSHGHEEEHGEDLHDEDHGEEEHHDDDRHEAEGQGVYA
ncbi:TonB-dependent receptor plug domain-containing protein [Parahaliea mediterranea]|uniref:TonB-dependent receptor plug domain-containing protein n=1 Tax=Parahaliea mediterranea TaxID=651086 RepID=UPI00321A6692